MGGVFCMELPKNITQIGEADKHCRIYVEDYVVSYIKQMNGMAQNKDIAIALYGRKTAEDGVAYLFAYGSAKLNFLQKPVRHLSQAQEQEIEKLRRKYFSEMTFLGYQILNGEMVEGFQICEQEICRYVSGYAQFYEKNDSMLAYMLENRGEEAAPEKVDQEKYEVVKKRQEERRQRQESGNAFRAAGHTENAPVEYRRAVENRRREPDNIIPMPTTGLRRMKMAAAGVFVLLCVMALALMRQESTGESLGETARQAMSNLMEQKLPDAVEEQSQISSFCSIRLLMEQKLPDAVEEQSQISTLVAEDKLEDALRQENAAAGNTTGAAAETAMPEGTENASMDGTGNSAVDSTEENTGSVADGTSADSNVTKNTTDVTEATEQNTTQETIQDVTQTAEPAVAETPTVEAVAQPTHYTIQRGDTLIGISLRNYGSNSKVSEICSLNGIADPDDIKIGQEILLP